MKIKIADKAAIVSIEYEGGIYRVKLKNIVIETGSNPGPTYNFYDLTINSHDLPRITISGDITQ